MTIKEFLIWLDGYNTISNHLPYTDKQIKCVYNHIQLVEYTITNLYKDILVSKYELELYNTIKNNLYKNINNITINMNEQILNPQLFCYWLQGYFEIYTQSYSSLYLQSNQIELITNKLNIVLENIKADKTTLLTDSLQFCLWLGGFLYNIEHRENERSVKVIQNKLNKVFIHEVDNSYNQSETQSEIMNNIHNGKYDRIDENGENQLLRC